MANENEWDFSCAWRIERFPLFDPYWAGCYSRILHRFPVSEYENEEWILEISACVEKLYFFSFKKRVSSKSTQDMFLCSEIQIMIGNRKTFKTFTYEDKIEVGMGYFKGNSIMMEELLQEMKKFGSDTFTLHYSVKRRDGGRTPLAQKSEIRTRFLTDKSCFELRLKFFKNSHSVIGRKYFSLGDMFYEIEAETDAEFVTINIHKLSKNSSTILILCNIALLDVAGNALASYENIHYFDSKKKTSNFFKSITKDCIKRKSKKIVKDGEIVLKCEFRVFCETEVTIPKTETGIYSNIGSILSLIDDFREMLSSGNHPDVDLKSENKVVKANKCVLVARSPVFSAMFNSDMLESRTGNVDVKDVDEDTLRSFVRFVYTGEVESLDCERASKLVLIAEKYQVDFLKEECCSFLISNICVENVFNIL